MPPPGRNKIRQTFADANESGGLIRPARKRKPPPFSIRFTEVERAVLDREAGKLSWAAYIRSRVFEDQNHIKQRPTRKRRTPDINQASIAQVLGALGQSRLSSNLNQIAKGANLGTLPVTPELEEDLKQACAEIHEMRNALIAALGIKNQ